MTSIKDAVANDQTEGSHVESATKPDGMLERGRAILEAERHMTLHSMVKRHWRSLMIASVSFTSAMVFGYDTVGTTASMSIPSFLDYFGSIGPTGPYIPSLWASLWPAMSSLTQAVGSLAAGSVTDQFGRKWPACACAILTLVGTAIQYVSKDSATLLGGKIVSGPGIGGLLSIGTTYIGEVTPLQLRGPSQAILVIFILLTQGAALGVVRAFVPKVEESSFRNIIAIQWAVGAVAAIAWAAVPESPVWLATKHKTEAGRLAMRRVYGVNNSPDERLEELNYAIQLEEEQGSAESGRYLACFQGHNLKRTLTVAFLYSIVNIGGGPLLAQNIYFLLTAGLQAVHSFDIGIGGFGFAIVLIMVGGIYLQRVSRRNVVLAGLLLNLVFMTVIGSLYWASGKGGLWAIAILMNVLISIQAATLQGAGWPLANEIPSYLLRAKTVSIGLCFQTGTTWLFTFITPYMYNVDSGNLGAKTAFIYAGSTILLLWCAWWLVPNTTGLSIDEIDGAYAAGVAPRDFQKFQQDLGNRSEAGIP